ncbi:bifunctional acetate--CoA ligase family protein/GNAT family N-acetyltransferase [bacterium]|nr:bifunctional acetate--CoA ligase family protein/GNAT family N-acetyltransferase [bacterium]
MGIYNLDKMFSPVPSANSVIAIVGFCSCNQQSKEWQLYCNLVAGGGRRVCMVTVGHQCAYGCPIPKDDVFSCLEDVPEGLELVVMLGPLAETPDLVDQCGRLGVHSLVIMSAKSHADEDFFVDEIMVRARKSRLRILGLNSSGFIVPTACINLSLFDIPVVGGGLALLSQSGAAITSILGVANERGVGFSHVVGLGALTDIDFGDMIDYLGWSARVSCILLYLENLKDVKKFMSACRSVAMIKPIVAIKVGKSELGRRVIEKHTGRPAGDEKVYDTAFRRAGIIRVDSVDELLAAGDFLVKNDVPEGRRLGIITNSGGLGVLAVDALARKNVAVTVLSLELGDELQEYIAPYSGTLDPICIAADADIERYKKVLELNFVAKEFDTIILVVVLNHWLDPVALVSEMRESAAKAKVNLVYVWVGDRSGLIDRVEELSDRKTRICFTIEDAILSCHYALRYYEKLSKLVVIPQRYSLEVAYNQKSIMQSRKLIEDYLERQKNCLSSHEARELLSLYGVPVNRSYIVTSPDEALQICSSMGYPMVMKIDCDMPLYESGIDGVLLNVRSDQAMVKGFGRLHQVAQAAGLNTFNLTVEKMVEGVDYEINLGSYSDVEFGPYIFLGAGGVYARISADVEVVLPPLDRALAQKLIKRTKLSECCDGVRPFALEELEDTLLKVSQMVVDLPEIDKLVLDPLIIAGGRLVAVDAKLNLKKTKITSPAHLATTPYPNQYEFHETLKDGTSVLIRPIKPEDAAAHYKMVAGFSSQTRYFRFFSLREEITPEQMARFTQIDYEREVAVIAEIELDGEKSSIGVNRLLYYPHTEEYEFAIVVTDAWQHSGAGYYLMEKLIYIAKDRGIKEIFGLVIRSNSSMMNFIKKFGFEIVEREIDVCRVRLRLVDEQ